MSASAEIATARRPIGELRLAARPSELFTARAYAAQAAAAFGLDADGCYDFAYAVNEAVTNAIRHGAPDEHGQIHLSVVAHGDRLTLIVRDYGTFTAPIPDSHTPLSERHATSENGRGLALMSLLTDEIQLCIEPGSTAVHLSKARMPTRSQRGD